MNRKTRVALFVVAATAVLGTGVTATGPEAEKAALEAAQSWLSIVDQGDYARSWETAARFFQTAVRKDQWEASLRAFRRPLGAVLSRKVVSKTYATSLPGAPDGEYVVIQFQTSFSNKKSAVETVTPMREKDGTWHVSGYYIK